ncbi:MAG: GUN4 domain-containing protein [Cyanobacteria bacterium P01_F01_bin.86]
MPEYEPTTLEKVFELLDTRLVTFGVPGALSFVGITKIRENLWREASLCFAGAAGVWIAIKVGKKLAPKLDALLDWGVNQTETALLAGVTAMRSDFTKRFLKQQAHLNEEFITEGYNPDRTAIPMLEDVFVPLALSGTIASLTFNPLSNSRDAALYSENLNIWELLRRSRKDRPFRQMVIQAKGGMGKTTLLRHIALIYGQRKQRRYRAPKLVPILLRLRHWVDEVTLPTPPSLPQLITDDYLPKLWDGQDHPPTPPLYWATNLLTAGKALILLDGFDEILATKRPEVSHWISQQMRRYNRSVFILTSRPAGYKDYTARKPAIPIFVKKFSSQQQRDFIRRWYLCQESCFRSQRQRHHAKTVAKERSDNLITQLTRREELSYMAENPLLLNMLVTFHRLAPHEDLPRQRLELYRGIGKLQLEDRPRARGIRMLVAYSKSMALLQRLAFGMLQSKRLTLPRDPLLKFLRQLPQLTREEVAAEDWLQQIVAISELLVERESGEYEFPHASFQGFFAATLLAQSEDDAAIQKHAGWVLKNWQEAIWRETVLLYTAQLPPKLLNQVIRKACEQGSEASDLAAACLQEYPRPEKINEDLSHLLKNLKAIAQDSKYQTLKQLLQANRWREADQETYRLMITTVGKEMGQWLDPEDLLNFPCEDLKAIDGVWVRYSQGKFGFSVQKDIYVACGAKLDGEYPGKKIWYDLCNRIGWRNGKDYVDYDDLQADLKKSLPGEFPRYWWWVGLGGLVGGRVRVCVSLLSHPDL